ncbi:MAG TPA: DUF507 family protein [Dissulfurispiraceae bacterium]|nr:DUF507 family protein [Dissulfurispiraceae bacterium]
MMLSEDKITHTTHMLLRGLLQQGLIEAKVEESDIRREMKRVFVAELKIGEDIDSLVRAKIDTLSKKLVEGSPEWDIVYKKYYEEEENKRGRR